MPVRFSHIFSLRRPRAGAWALFAALVLCAWLGANAHAGRVSITGPAPGPAKSWDCDRCNVQALFMRRMHECGVSMEIIELKNGVGVLYSAEDPRLVPRVQRNAEWARDELTRISLDPDRFHLCSYCKASRAVFSKVDREVVRTSQGALFLMRSNEPEAAKALKDMIAKTRSSDTSPAPSR